MQALVLNITNWISFHIADRLLQEGYQVKAMNANDENEHLTDFFARNSNFELVDEPGNDSFEIAICAGSPPASSKEIQVEPFFVINSDSKSIRNMTSIHVPYLFGKWMPMTEEAFIHHEKRIDFSDPEFLNKAVYIEDFLNTFVSWIEKPPTSADLYVRSKKNKDKTSEKLEKTFLVEENVTIEESVKQVLAHYHQFKDLYPKLE